MSGDLGSALATAIGGMEAQSEVLAATAENIANVDTNGYKAWITTLSAGAPNGAPLFVPQKDTSQGFIYTTGVPSDVAINGNGYFEVTLPDGQTAYTRDGSFQVSASGAVVDANGNPVLGMNGEPIVATFTNPGGLSGGSNNLEYATEASGAAIPNGAGAGTVIHGALEDSNVDLSDQFVNLIVAKDAYAASARVVIAADSMMKTLLSIA